MRSRHSQHRLNTAPRPLPDGFASPLMLEVRCSISLLIHALVLVGVTSGQPALNPRGWQAARQAEERARAPVATAASGALLPVCGEQGRADVCLAAAGQQQPTSSLRGSTACRAGQQPAWAQLGACALFVFLVGVAAGMLLLHAMLRVRQQLLPHAQKAAAAQHPGQSEAASCVPHCGGPPARRGSEPAAELPLDRAAVEPAAQPAAAAHEGLQSEPGGKQEPAAVSEGLAESSGESPAVLTAGASAAAAVAAAVQELVLQQSGSSSMAAEHVPAPAGSAAVPAVEPGEQAATSGRGQPQQQLEQATPQQEGCVKRRQGAGPPPTTPSDAAALAPAGPRAAALLGLAALREEDRADVQGAAQLVLAMCRAMHIEPAQLDRGERLQLIYTMLHAWQAQTGQRHAQEMSRWGVRLGRGRRGVLVPDTLRPSQASLGLPHPLPPSLLRCCPLTATKPGAPCRPAAAGWVPRPTRCAVSSATSRRRPPRGGRRGMRTACPLSVPPASATCALVGAPLGRRAATRRPRAGTVSAPRKRRLSLH